MRKNNSMVRWIGMGLVIAGLLTSIIATWTVYGKDIEDNYEDIGILKEEGCKPSQQHKIDIVIVQKDIKQIKKDSAAMAEDVEEMRTEQQQGFKEILKRLPK
ncbi:hypothetical protein LCGC14_2142870 [marine sediment metagenome]|uniref:Uncharacterized protein n=1 Tax=marine sediment metagenome TaxID=412755 RepID=A0A0F9DXU4_9ZZZZ